MMIQKSLYNQSPPCRILLQYRPLLFGYSSSPNNPKLTHVKNSPSPLKRKIRKPKIENYKNVIALSTAESYNLEELSEALQKQNIYELVEISEEIEDDVLPLRAKYKVNDVPRDIFIFREGSLVCWNCAPEEIENLIEFVSNYQQSPYDKSLVQQEKEEVDYLTLNDIARSRMVKGVLLGSRSFGATLSKDIQLSQTVQAYQSDERQDQRLSFAHRTSHTSFGR